MPVTPESLQLAWQAIRTRIPYSDSGDILEQSLVTHGGIEMSAVVRTRDTMPGILVRVSSLWSPRSWQVLRLAGVRFESAITENKELLLPVMLVDEDSITVFSVFAADLASVISASGTMNARMGRLMDKIDLWRRFFSKSNGPLSEEKVRGLIGECEMLRRMIGAFGVDVSLGSWRGPAGELHDFRQDRFRIEVKTWINEHSPRIFISDPSQILVDESWPVYLAAVQLANDDTTGTTLPDYIEKLLDCMTSHQRTIMEIMLADVGYLFVHVDLYSRRYSIRDVVCYRITGGFPMIDPATLPGGITNLKYALELGALTPFIAPLPF